MAAAQQHELVANLVALAVAVAELREAQQHAAQAAGARGRRVAAACCPRLRPGNRHRASRRKIGSAPGR